jgi:hypothetical protein
MMRDYADPSPLLPRLVIDDDGPGPDYAQLHGLGRVGMATTNAQVETSADGVWVDLIEGEARHDVKSLDVLPSERPSVCYQAFPN